MIESDSGEYEYLSEGVELSKYVEGFLVEIGVRRGYGTKIIIDAAIEHRPGSIVLGIDPFGSIEYIPREHMPPCRLDYDNPMGKQCLADLSAYVLDKPIEWIPFKMTDEYFFDRFENGIEVYDIETKLVNKYAFVHLDGPHHFGAIYNEFMFFNSRMNSGSVIVIDDCTEDFINIKPVNELFDAYGWALLKTGVKKNIYQKQ